MKIFVDIDQTISTGYIGSSVQESIAYYRSLHIEIPPDTSRYIDFFTLPEVVRLHEVLPGAQDGIRQLAAFGDITYATARKPDVEQITRDWLVEHGFPSSEQVIFCAGVSEKLLAIAAHPGPLVLVDDRWHQLMDIVGQYGETHRVIGGMRDRLTLVAFGVAASAIPGVVPVPVLPLPDWSNITELLQSERFTNVVGVHTRKGLL
jgi:uncharacterized HAD superfamily protein